MSGLSFTRTTPVYGPQKPSRLTLMGIRLAEGDGGDGSGAGGGAFVPPATQADFDRIIGERVSRAERQVEQKYAAFSGIDLAELTAKANELATLKANQGNDLNEVNGKLTAAETRATTAEGTTATLTAENAELKAKVLRYDVAADNGIPLTHAARLIGASKEELDADAKAYKRTLRTSGYDPGQGQHDGGASASDEGNAEADRRFGSQKQN